MLKLTLAQGEQLNIGEDIHVIYKRGSATGIKIVLDVPKEMPITRIRESKSKRQGGVKKTTRQSDLK
jgi:sRNA-binding carbon storage regulator CsrA